MVNVGGVELVTSGKMSMVVISVSATFILEKDLHPQVFYLKKLLRRLNAKHRRLLSVLELVGSLTSSMYLLRV